MTSETLDYLDNPNLSHVESEFASFQIYRNPIDDYQVLHFEDNIFIDWREGGKLAEDLTSYLARLEAGTTLVFDFTNIGGPGRTFFFRFFWSISHMALLGDGHRQLYFLVPSDETARSFINVMQGLLQTSLNYDFRIIPTLAELSSPNVESASIES